MKMLKVLKSLPIAASLFAASFWACSDTENPQDAGVWEDEPAIAGLESSSSLLEIESSDSEVPASSSLYWASSSSVTLESSSSYTQGIHIPENKGCVPEYTFVHMVSPKPSPAAKNPAKMAKPSAEPVKEASYAATMMEEEKYGVLSTFVEKRIEVLEKQGVAHDSAWIQAAEELLRELGLDTLLDEHPKFTVSHLEYTLYYLYKDKSVASTLNPELIEDFADGKLEPGNYCINNLDYQLLDDLPFDFMPLGCAYGTDQIAEPAAIMRNIWRKCSAMPYCDGESIKDTVAIGDAHFICTIDSNSMKMPSWLTLEMTGAEKGGHLCTEDFTNIEVQEERYLNRYVCYKGKWRTMTNTDDFPAEYFFNPDINYGTFTDPRDGHVYKTTEYNGQTWLAQDIDYYDENDTLFTEYSLCGKNASDTPNRVEDRSYCDGGSRFYMEETAKKACPEGWRLPTKSEWPEKSTIPTENEAVASLFSKNSSANHASDAYGLSLRTMAYIDPYGWHDLTSAYNYFWLGDGGYAMNSSYYIHHYDTIDYRERGQFIPVRCVKE